MTLMESHDKYYSPIRECFHRTLLNTFSDNPKIKFEAYRRLFSSYNRFITSDDKLIRTVLFKEVIVHIVEEHVDGDLLMKKYGIKYSPFEQLMITIREAKKGSFIRNIFLCALHEQSEENKEKIKQVLKLELVVLS